MHLREAHQQDGELLTVLLLEAVNWTGEERQTREEMLADHELSHYVDGWQRPGDFGMVAIGDAGRSVGAAWARTLTAEDPGFGYVADDIPEFGMALLPESRGLGIGSALLAAHIEQARTLGYRALSLSVEIGNDRARALYVRQGFVAVERVGGSDTMLLDLSGR